MSKYKVKKEDLIGGLKGIPLEVAQTMVNEQVKQGNKADVKIFQDNYFAAKEEGGFDCRSGYWRGIVGYNNFSLFNKKQAEEKPYPKVMYVGQTKEDIDNKYKRVVFAHKKGKYVSWLTATTLEEAEEQTETFAWKLAKDIPEKVEVSLEEIAQWKGIEVEQIKIVKEHYVND